MKYLIILFTFAIFGNVYSAEDFYNLKAKKINGDTLYFSELRGKKLMIVNVASYCGYTYQYAQLQSLYEQYGGDNFEIIGFPANNFNGQEPGTDLEIEDFCTSNYGVTFTMMSKISVRGLDRHSVYHWLTSKAKNGVLDSEVAWNFQKYMIDENGKLWRFFSTQTSPLHQDIINWLESTTNVVELGDETTFRAYPNPALDYIDIDFSSDSVPNDIKIINILGENLDKRIISYSNNTLRLDLSHLSKGVYIIVVDNQVNQFIKM